MSTCCGILRQKNIELLIDVMHDLVVLFYNFMLEDLMIRCVAFKFTHRNREEVKMCVVLFKLQKIL